MSNYFNFSSLTLIFIATLTFANPSFSEPKAMSEQELKREHAKVGIILGAGISAAYEFCRGSMEGKSAMQVKDDMKIKAAEFGLSAAEVESVFMQAYNESKQAAKSTTKKENCDGLDKLEAQFKQMGEEAKKLEAQLKKAEQEMKKSNK